MGKFLLILGIILIGAYFALEGVWMMQVSAFGYEVSFSAIVLIMAFIILMYLLHLLGKPAQWVRHYRTHKLLKNDIKKLDALQLALITILDKNEVHENMILKGRTFSDDNSKLNALLIEAIFSPNRTVFEQLLTYPQTKLAGLRGLIEIAKQEGNFSVQESLLTKAATDHPKVSWILRDLLTVQLVQDNPTEALKTLEKLADKKGIDKDRYNAQKAEILYRLKRYKEAFNLTPDNPMVALAYAQSEPKKAALILKKAWTFTPDWDVYEAYRETISALSAKKRMKEMEAFLESNQAGGIYLIAMANEAVQNNDWADAKENLKTYLGGYPLTRQVALMMAKIEGDGYHHADAARDWIQKSEGL